MATPITIGRNSWVRITHRGRYRNDLGLVRSVDKSSLSAEVYLVPRISSDRKRDRRCRLKRALFDAKTVEATFGAGPVVKENDMWLFKGNKFVHGLQEKTFELYELSDRSVNAAQDELELFHQTRDTWVVDASLSGIITLQVSDKVRVVAGPCLGLTGVVMEINGDTVMIQANGLLQSQQVRRWEVCKHFDRGDFVHVLHGEHIGAEGFIIDMNESFVTLFSHCLDDLKQLTVNVKYIDWKSSGETLRKSTSVIGMETESQIPSGQVLDDSSQLMYTGEQYKNVEVKIVDGDAKGNFGVVFGYRELTDNTPLLSVRTETRSINHILTLNVDAVRERHSGLPLPLLRYVPINYITNTSHRKCMSSSAPSASTPASSSTPMHRPEGPLSPAWDPSSAAPMLLGGSSQDDDLSSTSARPGEWLLNRRLLGKRLDVRIQGTRGPTMWCKGQYEDQIGFTVLTSVPQNVDNLFPETTTETERFVARQLARPVISTQRSRLVIIGPDTSDNNDFIGNYSYIVNSLIPMYAGVYMESAPDQTFYFPATSLCLSLAEVVEWNDRPVS